MYSAFKGVATYIDGIYFRFISVTNIYYENKISWGLSYIIPVLHHLILNINVAAKFPKTK